MMNLKNGFLVGVGTLAIAALAGGIIGGIGFWSVIFLAAVLFSVPMIDRHILVRVKEMEMGVAFNVESGAFTRFLPPGRHLLAFPLEQIKARISTAPGNVGGEVLETQTGDGLPVTMEWTLLFVLNPQRIAPDLRPRLARSLPKFANTLIRNHVNNCVQQLVSEQLAKDLVEVGARGRVERVLRQRVAERLAPFGVEVFRVMVTAVALPTNVQAKLEDAHNEVVFAQSQAMVMERWHEAISKFNDREMEWLMELARMRVLGQNGILMQMPYAHVADVVEMRANGRQARNGAARSSAPLSGDGASDGSVVWPPSH